MIAPLVFTVAGSIATKGSTRAFPYRRKDGRIGVSVTHANRRTTGDQLRIAWAAQDAMLATHREPFVGAVAVRIDVFLARPDSVKRALPTVKPDLDKLVRLVLDALARVVFGDDAVVCRLNARKRYAASVAHPYVSIEVSEDA
jgi:Holliday junction resolvase RusA-like endonuclease